MSETAITALPPVRLLIVPAAHHLPSRGEITPRRVDVPRLPHRRNEPAGLRCPYCLQQTAKPAGGCTYVCGNPDCTGGSEELGKFTSILIVDAANGAHLLPWREGQQISEDRLTDPLAALRNRELLR